MDPQPTAEGGDNPSSGDRTEDKGGKMTYILFSRLAIRRELEPQIGGHLTPNAMRIFQPNIVSHGDSGDLYERLPVIVMALTVLI